MADTLYLDTETFNSANLKTVGTYRYAETAEVMLLSYALNDGDAEVWDRTETPHMPDELMGALHEALFGTEITVIAHNAMFDRNVLRLGDMQLEIPIARWDDTMAQAMSHALPGQLELLGQVLGLPQEQQKLADGKKLIQKFCTPNPKTYKQPRYTRETHPEEWARFVEYARMDIVAMREIRKRLPTWNWKPEDIADWHLDQVINDRGFKVDMELARAGQQAAIREKASIAERFSELTGGLTPGQREKVKDFLLEHYDLPLDGTAKHIMTPLSEDASQPDEVREIAALMLQANKTSTAKYGAMVEAVSSDGRFRGGLQFAGAGRTRRWAGRIFQGQNLPSRDLPDDVDLYIAALKAGVHDMLFDDLMLYGAAALRGLIVAEEG